MNEKNDYKNKNIEKAKEIQKWILRQYPGATIEIKESINEQFGNEVIKIILKKDEFNTSEKMQLEIDIHKCFEPSMDIEIVF